MSFSSFERRLYQYSGNHEHAETTTVVSLSTAKKPKTLAEKRARQRELTSMRDAKNSRGTAKIDVLVTEGRYTDIRNDGGRIHKKPRLGSVGTDAPSPRPPPEPVKTHHKHRMRISCCNDPLCVRDQHNHDKDWTYFGKQFHGRKPLRKDVVPDPYKIHSFPRRFSVHSSNPRDDIQLMAAAANRNPGAMIIQLARMVHTEERNLDLTYSEMRTEHEKTYIPLMNEARVRATTNPEFLRETELAAQRSELKFTLAVPASKRQLHNVARTRIADIFDFCDVQLPPNTSRLAAEQHLFDIVRLYNQDCSERSMHTAANLVLDGIFDERLQRAVDGIGSGSSTKSDSLRGSVKFDDVFKRTFRQRLSFPCRSQWETLEALPACASIAVSACVRFLCAAEAAERLRVQTDRYLTKELDWGNVVKEGMAWYVDWKENNAAAKVVNYQLVKEVVEGDSSRFAVLCRLYYFDELFGTLVAAAGADSGVGAGKNFGEFIAALEKTDCYKADRPLACAFSSGHYTLAFARLSGGAWWLFDSHGKDRVGLSTLGRFLRAKELVDYINAFFGVPDGPERELDLTNEHETMPETTLATLVSFSAYMFYKK